MKKPESLNQKIDRILTLDGRVSKKILFGLLVMVASWAFYLYDRPAVAVLDTVTPQQFLAQVAAEPAGQSTLSLITQPDDGVEALKEAIENADREINVVLYQLQDMEICQLLVDAKNRGVDVRVILQKVSNFGRWPNQPYFDFLKEQGVEVKWAGEQFFLTHQKTLIVDDQEAFVMTFNWQPQYYATSRDFGLATKDALDVAAITEVFDADWDGRGIAPSSGRSLVWSPGAADDLLVFIESAKKSLDIYTLELADDRIMNALIEAKDRGVKVRVVMTYGTGWKDELNELVQEDILARTFASSAKTFVHAKVMIADNILAFVGSQNFSGASLNDNRELGMIISKPEIIESLKTTFENDFSKARVYNVRP